MSLAIFNYPLPAYAYSVGLVRPGIVTQFGGQTEQRSSRSGRTYRTFPYVWAALTDAEKVAFDAFFVAQSMTLTSFLWRDPSDGPAEVFYRDGVSCGTSTLTQTVFSLPTGASEAAGDYPVADARAALFSNGVQVATTTVQTDARTLTAGVAPGSGKTITAAYAFYRRVRLDQPYTWARGDTGLWSTQATFREVPA